MLRCLVAHGASNDPQELATALSSAARAGQLNAVKQLFLVGAAVDARPRSGDSAIVAAAASGVPDVVQEILAHRPDISIHGQDGRTALIAAVDGTTTDDNNKAVDRLRTVHLLLDAGADVNARQ